MSGGLEHLDLDGGVEAAEAVGAGGQDRPAAGTGDVHNVAGEDIDDLDGRRAVGRGRGGALEELLHRSGASGVELARSTPSRSAAARPARAPSPPRRPTLGFAPDGYVPADLGAPAEAIARAEVTLCNTALTRTTVVAGALRTRFGGASRWGTFAGSGRVTMSDETVEAGHTDDSPGPGAPPGPASTRFCFLGVFI